MKYNVYIEKDYEESWVSIIDEEGERIAHLPLRESEVLAWLESRGMLEDFIKFMIKKMLNEEWIDYWEEIKYKYELEIEID